MKLYASEEELKLTRV